MSDSVRHQFCNRLGTHTFVAVESAERKGVGGRRTLTVCLLIALWASLVSPLSAQTATTGGTAGESTVEPAVESVSNVSETAATTTDATIPEHFIASVRLDAKVVSERIDIQAEVEVVITHGDGWHRIPLRFDQAHVESREYVGEGEEAPDFQQSAGDEGIFWMLKGVGKHLLTLNMWVPVQDSTRGSSFLLALPPLPSQFYTRLTLTIPDANAVVQPTSDVAIRADPVRNQRQVVYDVSVFRNRVDLTWNVPRGESTAVSKATTRYHVRPVGDSLVLMADQTLDFQRPGVKELRIRKPSQFELIEPLDKVTEDNGDWMQVRLGEQNSLRTELRWVFRKPLPEDGTEVTVDGLEVEGAAQQVGTVRIDDVLGYRIVPQLQDSRLIYRISPRAESQPADDAVNSLYEFLQQPFRLTYQVEQNEPIFVITPVYEFQLRADEQEFIVHQLISVERGSVDELAATWSELKSAGWEFRGATSAGALPEQVHTTVDVETGEIRSRFSAPLQAGRRVHVVSRFRRSAAVGDDSQLTLTLPTFAGRSVPSEVLILIPEAPFELRMTDALQSGFERLDPESLFDRLSETGAFSPATLKSWESAAELTLLRVGEARQMELNAIRHAAAIETNSTIEIQHVSSSDLLIRQLIDIQADYTRIQQLELDIPPALQKLMQFENVTKNFEIRHRGDPVLASFQSGRLQINLLQPIVGRDVIEISYRFPVQAQESVRLPILHVDQHPFREVECLIGDEQQIQVDPSAENWTPVLTSPAGLHWIQTQWSADQPWIPLDVGETIASSSQRYIIDVAQLWTRLDENGVAETFARYELSHPPASLVVEFSAPVQLVVRVDGIPLDPEMITDSPGGRGRKIIRIPDNLEDRRLIEFHYRETLNTSFALAERVQFAFPKFSENVWINESVWELQLPHGHHLFEYPQLKPLFGWQRQGVLWRRAPSARYLESRDQIAKTLPGSLRFDDNYYPFRGYSSITRVEFATMNRSLILLVGAGFAFSLGFLFYRFPVTRHLFSLLVIAMIFSIASLWYLEPMLLLLQPAIVGVVLALTATLINVRSSRRGLDRSTLQTQPLPSADGSLSDAGLVTGDGSTRLYAPTESSVSNMPEL